MNVRDSSKTGRLKEAKVKHTQKGEAMKIKYQNNRLLATTCSLKT